MTTTTKKETTAQRVERLKRARNPWEGLEEIRRFAREGWDSIPPEWNGTYFRWWGVYTQGDGNGVMGGTGGVGRALQRFMVRIRIPNGILTSNQLRTIADLTRRYANGIADLTVRQNIQLHWVTIEALPEVMEGLWQVGLNTMGACGDVARNVTGCPVAGVDHDEIVDASPLVLEASRLLAGNAEFYNLPRKFKISIAGCRSWCSYPEINDIGLTAITRTLDGKPEVGFSLRVGGGLSADPYLGARLNAFVRWNQVLPVIKGVAELFRDSEVLREHRERARLKFLFLRHGWTAERFLGELQDRIGFKLDPAAEEHSPDDVYRDHVGIHAQKQSGLSYVGAVVLRGRITADQMQSAADLGERYAGGELRATSMQNLLVVNVPTLNAEPLAKELDAIGFRVGGSSFARGTIACSGTEFCKIAITETKSFSRWLVEEMDERLPGFDQHLKLHVTGCPNSCGQHWIADVGLEGKKTKVNGEMVDAYYFCVGGALGLHQGTARPVGYRCAATEVPEALERLLGAYLAEREEGENLRRFFARHTDTQIREFLAGESVQPVPRDLPIVAHGLAQSAEDSVTNLFPMFIKLEGRQVVVVGAGKVGEPKISGLFGTGARIRVVSLDASATVREWARAGWIELELRAFTPDDLEGAFMAIVATSSRTTNERVYDEAQRRGILCNVVDVPDLCDFFYPSVVRRGDLQIAVSTAGQSPSLAQRIRQQLEKQFGPGYAEWVAELGATRKLILASDLDKERKLDLLHSLASREAFEAAMAEQHELAVEGEEV